MNTVRMRLEARESESGGSLIELAIATAIAIVLVGAVMHITVYSSKVRKADEELRLAWSACRNIVEEVRILPVDQIPALNGQGFDVPGPNGESNGLNLVESNVSGMPGLITTSVEATDTAITLYRVQVTVTWTGISGEQDFSLQTLIAKR